MRKLAWIAVTITIGCGSAPPPKQPAPSTAYGAPLIAMTNEERGDSASVSIRKSPRSTSNAKGQVEPVPSSDSVHRKAQENAQVQAARAELDMLAHGGHPIAKRVNPPLSEEDQTRELAAEKAAQQARQEAAAREQSRRERLVSWEDFSAVFGSRSATTTLQCKAVWPRFAGKEVEWKGEVRAVDEIAGHLVLRVRMEKETLTSDVHVSLEDDQVESALRLSLGDSVRFSGILEDWGGVLYTAKIGKGRILGR